MISEVSDSDFQAQNVKDAFTTAASSSTSSVSTETSKEMESLAKETPTHFIITDINFQRARY